MSRLVLRISLGILFVLLMAGLIFAIGVRHAADKHLERYVGPILTRLYSARQQLDSTPPAETATVLASLRQTNGHPITLRAVSDPRLPAAARRAAARGEFHVVHHPGSGRTYYLPVRQGSRVLVFGPTGRPPWSSHKALIVVLLGLLLIVGVTGAVVAWPLVRRLGRLERAAARIGSGELSARAQVEGRDAIGLLATRFNHMAERVQSLLEQQRELLQAVSHELRTPVARLRFGLELLDGEEDAEQRRQRVQALTTDLGELESLVDELLLYIRVGDDALELDRQPCALAELLPALAKRCAEARPGRQISLLPSEPDEGVLDADPRYLQRALRNLIDNALQHAAERVELRWQQAGDVTLVHVDDDGPGVATAQRERILEAFARGDRSRDRADGGLGLGLAIARRIVVAHGGQLLVTGSPLGGARFTLRWPPSVNGVS